MTTLGHPGQCNPSFLPRFSLHSRGAKSQSRLATAGAIGWVWLENTHSPYYQPKPDFLHVGHQD